MQFPSGFNFDIQIDNYVGFLQINDLINFEMIETVGIEVPTVEALFITSDKKVKDMLLENNIIKIIMGEDASNLDTFEVSVLEKNASNHQTNSYSCYFKGLIGDKRFLLNKVQKGLKSNPLEGIGKVCDMFSKGFGAKLTLESNIASTQNIESQIQNWLILDESYRTLMVDMWSHLDIRPSFPLIALNRYNKVILKDFNNLVASTPKWNFTKDETNHSPGALPFSNNFAVENNTEVYNIYAGYGKNVNIYDTEKGNYEVHVHEPSNLLGASQEIETSKAGSRTLNGFKKSSNITENYHEAYMFNISRLMAISNICGFVDFPYMYNKNLNLLDLIILTLANSEQGRALSGKYIVHTIVYNFSSVLPFLTRVYISRDSNNDIENSIARVDTGIKIPSISKEAILGESKLSRVLLGKLKNYLGEDIYNEIINYLSSLKYGLLDSFSTTGSTISLNSQLLSLNSLYTLGQNIFYKLLNKYIPSNLQSMFKSTGWGADFNLLSLLNSIVQQYAPQKIANAYFELLMLINSINNEVHKLKSTAIKASGANKTMLPTTNSNSSTRVNTITKSMLDNLQELSVPITIVDLTPSQQLLSDDKLKVLIADNITNDLINKGYLNGFSTDPKSTDILSINNFKNILLGITVIDTQTIATINNNIQGVLYARYWGSFSDVNTLDDYTIRKGFQDYSKIPDCTKIISALGGKGIYMAIPTTSKELVFSIDGVILQMLHMPMNLKVPNTENDYIDYTVYYTDENTRFNSASTSLKIVQGA